MKKGNMVKDALLSLVAKSKNPNATNAEWKKGEDMLLEILKDDYGIDPTKESLSAYQAGICDAFALYMKFQNDAADMVRMLGGRAYIIETMLNQKKEDKAIPSPIITSTKEQRVNSFMRNCVMKGDTAAIQKSKLLTEAQKEYCLQAIAKNK